MSFDEEYIDPHGECAAEIHRLRAERDSLAAQLAAAVEGLTETRNALDEMVMWFGGPHKFHCPEDDTCDCPHVQQVNSAMQQAARILSSLERGTENG